MEPSLAQVGIHIPSASFTREEPPLSCCHLRYASVYKPPIKCTLFGLYSVWHFLGCHGTFCNWWPVLPWVYLFWNAELLPQHSKEADSFLGFPPAAVPITSWPYFFFWTDLAQGRVPSPILSVSGIWLRGSVSDIQPQPSASCCYYVHPAVMSTPTQLLRNSDPLHPNLSNAIRPVGYKKTMQHISKISIYSYNS